MFSGGSSAWGHFPHLSFRRIWGLLCQSGLDSPLAKVSNLCPSLEMLSSALKKQLLGLKRFGERRCVHSSRAVRCVDAFLVYLYCFSLACILFVQYFADTSCCSARNLPKTFGELTILSFALFLACVWCYIGEIPHCIGEK